MNILGIATSPVIVTRTGTKVKQLRDLLKRKAINVVPVLNEEGVIAGIVSSSDLSHLHSDEILVDDIMTKKVHILVKNTKVVDAAKLMIKHKVHHLVIMDEGAIIGIVSSLDIINALTLD